MTPLVGAECVSIPYRYSKNEEYNKLIDDEK